MRRLWTERTQDRKVHFARREEDPRFVGINKASQAKTKENKAEKEAWKPGIELKLSLQKGSEGFIH